VALEGQPLYRKLHFLFPVVVLLSAVIGLPGANAAPYATKISQTRAHGFDCFSCHAISKTVVGPAWVTIANHYHHNKAKADYLANKIIHGAVGTFGNVPMPAHKSMSKARAMNLAEYILSLKGKVKHPSVRHYKYKTPTGKTVTVDFRVFKMVKGKRAVTKTVFKGYEKYNSYCFRCHGYDAVGGEYAPDLRRSLNNGMTKREFFTVAMVGNEPKGMPDWNGFFSAGQMQQIYEYVKARSLNLIGTGRPPTVGGQ
jgi:cytochrome c